MVDFAGHWIFVALAAAVAIRLALGVLRWLMGSGASKEQACSRCGVGLTLSMRFCPRCGKSITEGEFERRLE